MDKQTIALWIFLIIIFALVITVLIRQETTNNRLSQECISIQNRSRKESNSISDSIQTVRTNQTSMQKSIQETKELLQNLKTDIGTDLDKLHYKRKLQRLIASKTYPVETDLKQVSVVIPIYNGYEFLHSCLQSVLTQTYPPKEVIIGINGHPINGEVFTHALRVIKELEPSIEVKVMQFEKPSKSFALNNMVEQCVTNYIALLDVDDTWLPTKMEEQLKVLQEYDIDVIGTHAQYFGDRNNVPRLPSGFISPYHILKLDNPLINSSIIVKKEHAHWTDKYLGIDDYCMWIQLSLKDCLIYNVGNILVRHKVHQSSAFNYKTKSINSLTTLKRLYHEM